MPTMYQDTTVNKTYSWNLQRSNSGKIRFAKDCSGCYAENRL